MGFLDTIRTDRMFDSFLDLHERMPVPVNEITDKDDNSLQGSGLIVSEAIGRLRRRRSVKRLAADRAYEKYLDYREQQEDEGVGDILSFFEWLIQNKSAIFELIRELITLFGL